LTFTNDFTSDIIYNLEANVVISPDMFADARILTGTLPIVVYSNNSSATSEVGEPQHIYDYGSFYGPSKSIWFKWKATTSSTIQIGLESTTFYIGAGVYTGNAVNALSTITHSQVAYPRSYVNLSVSSGTDYYIAVDGFPGWSGDVRLAIAYFPDNFADAMLLTGALPISITANNTEATAEVNEPDHMYVSGNYYSVYKSLWYKWVSTVTGNVKLSMISPDTGYPSAAMYTDAISPPPYNRSTQIGIVTTSSETGVTYTSGSIPVVSGNTYYIATGFYSYYAGTFTLTISSV
jgi:hypothetical protein